MKWENQRSGGAISRISSLTTGWWLLFLSFSGVKTQQWLTSCSSLTTSCLNSTTCFSRSWSWTSNLATSALRDLVTSRYSVSCFSSCSASLFFSSYTPVDPSSFCDSYIESEMSDKSLSHSNLYWRKYNVHQIIHYSQNEILIPLWYSSVIKSQIIRSIHF